MYAARSTAATRPARAPVPWLLRALVLAVAALTAAACGADGRGIGRAGSLSGGRLDVVVSFYPLAYLVQRLGGSAVSVTDLTKPGAEPHELELSPRQVAAVVDADLVVYLKGFQPSVDAAVQEQSARGLDVAPAADLDRLTTAENGRGQVADPHFWLDPERFSSVAGLVAQRLRAADPARAGQFSAGLAALRQDLAGIDHAYRAGLADCATTDVVTSHAAFGYLAQRYGLRQVGITGLTPDAEPDAGTLAHVADTVRAQHVGTIYYETLVSPAIARTVAAETGARTAVLDPIEGITSASAAPDYRGLMLADLAALRAGQPCR